MITLPQLITTDTDMTAGLTSGKTTGSAEDFLALLAGALGADGAQGKDARITLADLQAASGKLSISANAGHLLRIERQVVPQYARGFFRGQFAHNRNIVQQRGDIVE